MLEACWRFLTATEAVVQHSLQNSKIPIGKRVSGKRACGRHSCLARNELPGCNKRLWLLKAQGNSCVAGYKPGFAQQILMYDNKQW